ncbi:MAG TPA: ribosomal-protein-alanine N-acetyltransferase [Euryarchaeota archaeon]|nr:acetyltransferase YpeA [archaeon BMS3Bbin15]HDL16154.1 ribosomal-protein-alanine N-acetyltransferase [Euryarchaeota archaeon]
MLIIRKFTPADISDVYKVEVESFEDPYHPIFLMNLYELHGDMFFVAEWAGKIVGYIIARKVGDSGHIIAIAVAKNLRKEGIGRMLMETVEKILLRKGVREIWLEVRVSNKEAIGFYTRLGYSLAGVQEYYYADGEDALILKKHFY